MPHVEYEKMFETTAHWVVPRTLQTSSRKWKPPADLWVVTEKVHGACFCLVTDGKEVRAAKRSSFLGADDDTTFFDGFRAVVAAHAERARSIHTALAATTPGLVRVSIYGELFGGGYAASAELLTREQRQRMVQTEIVYSPELAFYAFDIAVHTRERGGVKREYLPFDVAERLFREHGFFHAEPLFVGPFEQALHYNVDFETTIPRRLGLPSLGNWNRAEGIVVKPFRAVVYVGVDGGKPGQLFRAIVKVKAAQFLEKVATQKGSHRQQATSCGDAAAAVLAWLEQFVNANRVASTLSKHGPCRGRGRGNVAAAVVADALASAKDDDDDALMWAKYEALLPPQKQAVRQALERQAQALIDKAT